MREDKGINDLKLRLDTVTIPGELRLQLEVSLDRLSRFGNLVAFLAERDALSRYLDFVFSLPWNRRTEDNLDLGQAARVLERNHYGMEKIKERILEYLAVLNLTSFQSKRESPVLCFVGLPGVGKTSVASSIAEALGRKFIRIAFGGLGEVSQLRGLSYHTQSAEPGLILKSLQRVESKNPVILIDEVDRTAEGLRSSIMGVLLELLDPEQNGAFFDHYLDFPFDLSEAIFICTANNTRGISNAVLDRLEVIEMPSYNDEEKKVIGRDYLFPKIMKRNGLTAGELRIAEDLWPKIIRPLGYDSGIRTLERTLDSICRKTARKIVEREASSFLLDERNLKEFLPM